MEIVWNIPSESALDRLEELYEQLERFPDNKWLQEEIAILEELTKYL